jgi:hypothetical protein
MFPEVERGHVDVRYVFICQCLFSLQQVQTSSCQRTSMGVYRIFPGDCAHVDKCIHVSNSCKFWTRTPSRKSPNIPVSCRYSIGMSPLSRSKYRSKLLFALSELLHVMKAVYMSTHLPSKLRLQTMLLTLTDAPATGHVFSSYQIRKWPQYTCGTPSTVAQQQNAALRLIYSTTTSIYSWLRCFAISVGRKGHGRHRVSIYWALLYRFLSGTASRYLARELHRIVADVCCRWTDLHLRHRTARSEYKSLWSYTCPVAATKI